MNRVKYYSPGDWAGGYNLEKAEEIILKFDNGKYFDNKVYLAKWDE